MQHPFISLLVAILLFTLGGLLLSPDSGVRAARGPDGQVLHHPNGRPVMVQDHYRDLRVNGLAYLFYAAAAAAFGWTLILVAYGIVACVRGKTQLGAAPNVGPAVRPGNSGASQGPPSVS